MSLENFGKHLANVCEFLKENDYVSKYSAIDPQIIRYAPSLSKKNSNNEGEATPTSPGIKKILEIFSKIEKLQNPTGRLPQEQFKQITLYLLGIVSSYEINSTINEIMYQLPTKSESSVTIDHISETIRWIEFLPAKYESKKWQVTLDTINDGITFFKHVIEDGRDIGWCSKNLLPADRLYGAFRKALRSGAIHVYRVERHTDYEKKLTKIYKGKLRPGKIFVAKLPHVKNTDEEDDANSVTTSPLNIQILNTEIVSQLAAHTIIGEDLTGDQIAIGSGYIMERFAQHVVSRKDQKTFIPIQAFRNSEYINNSRSANGVATLLQSAYIGSTAKFLPYVEPSYRGNKITNHQQNSIDATNILKEARAATTMIYSIGAVEDMGGSTLDLIRADGKSYSFQQMKDIFDNFPPDLRERVVVTLLGYFLDQDGKRVIYKDKSKQEEVDKEFYSIDLETIRNKATSKKSTTDVWCIASTTEKARAMEVVINSGCCNSIVTDENIAKYLIDRHKESKK